MDKAQYFVVKADGECCEELDYWRRLVEKEPDDPGNWVGLGMARDRREEPLEALDAYDHALRLDPALPQAHHNRACALGSLGRSKEAVEAYKEALRLEPSYLKAHLGLGCALAKLGFDTEAQRAWEAAAQLDPRCYEAHHNLGGLFRKRDEHELAAASFARAAALEPEERDPDLRRRALTELHFFLGESWMELGRVGDAIAAYRKAIDLTPEEARAHNRLGIAYAETSQRELAVLAFDAAVRLEPYHGMHWWNLGRAHSSAGSVALAAHAYGQAHRLAPALPGLPLRRAEALLALGREDEAAEILLPVVARAGDDEERYEALNLLGNVYRRLRQWERAVEALSTAVAIFPDELAAHVNLFHALVGSGNKAAALARADAIRRLDSKKAMQLAASLES